tara:strand:- start:2165 stop:2362 length:198 start_codon:yes stop_codon:yes gene_type:complete
MRLFWDLNGESRALLSREAVGEGEVFYLAIVIIFNARRARPLLTAAEQYKKTQPLDARWIRIYFC